MPNFALDQTKKYGDLENILFFAQIIMITLFFCRMKQVWSYRNWISCLKRCIESRDNIIFEFRFVRFSMRILSERIIQFKMFKTHQISSEQQYCLYRIGVKKRAHKQLILLMLVFTTRKCRCSTFSAFVLFWWLF